MSQHAQARLAIDIGGTFTDIAVEVKGRFETVKTLTTPSSPVDGVIEGIGLALEKSKLTPGDFGAVIHGTTLATNALIEKKGARVGLITTEGFRDVLEIAYERRYDQYDLFLEKPEMLVPRDRCYTVPERMDANGSIHAPLDESAMDGILSSLDRDAVESVAVGLLHSYANPVHERRIRDLLLQHRPDLSVSISSEVCPVIREFDRLCTTVANAYVRPLMQSYLGDMEGALRGGGFDCPFFVITSGGGMTTLDTAVRFPIRLVESGPSGGAVLAAKVARQCDRQEVVSFDMGGTTAKICLIDDGEPRHARRFEVARAARFIKGSGLPVMIPVIEMIEIGAGGGSVASVDRLGRLTIGPQSTGADPGPACYGKGGDRATVTDADSVIGFINPNNFAAGRIKLDLDLARDAISKSICKRLELGVEAGALGISQMVDENMANAARVHSVEQGKDLTSRTMIAFGGNGPLHAARIAEKLGITEIIIPPDPGVGSAIGFLSAPVSYELARSYYTSSDSFDYDGVNALLAEMTREAEKVVGSGAMGRTFDSKRTAFMRYRGQGHEIEVAMPDETIDHAGLIRLCEVFERDYARMFGRSVPDMQIEFLNWSVVVSTARQTPCPACKAKRTQQARPTGDFRNWTGATAHDGVVPCYRREDLSVGDWLPGPAFIDEPQTTTLVPEDFEAQMDGSGNIVLVRRGDARVASWAAEADSAIKHQVMWNRLLAVVEEQSLTLMRIAFSEMVRECGDLSAGVFDLKGRMLAQAVTGTPGHINTMAEACKHMIAAFPADTMRPGDVYVTNDPWLASGHLNDLLLVAPVFHGGKPVALVSCTSHLYDIGGRGTTPDGADIYEEGIRLPPAQLVREGVVCRYIIDIVKANSRTAVSNEGDLYALIACCDIGGRRLSQLMNEFGIEDLEALADYILSTSRAGTVAAIRSVPNGRYENEVRLDGYDFEIQLRARMQIEDETITVDMTGTSPCSRFGINVPQNYAAAYAVFGIRCVVGPEVPNNAGSLEPIRFTAPENSIVNAQDPAPVAMRHMIGHILPDVMLGCLHQALPGCAPAEGVSSMWNLTLRSTAETLMRGNATIFATDLNHNGGTGARSGKDGLSATAYPSGVWGSQVETVESAEPLRYLRRELLPDTGGPGQFRGGLGQFVEVENKDQAPMLLMASFERMRYSARGRAGGGDGQLGVVALGSGQALPGKGIHEIPAGDKLVVKMPGGGGYGDPRARERADTLRDLRLGLISPEAAKRDYGLVADE